MSRNVLETKIDLQEILPVLLFCLVEGEGSSAEAGTPQNLQKFAVSGIALPQEVQNISILPILLRYF